MVDGVLYVKKHDFPSGEKVMPNSSSSVEITPGPKREGAHWGVDGCSVSLPPGCCAVAIDTRNTAGNRWQVMVLVSMVVNPPCF